MRTEWEANAHLASNALAKRTMPRTLDRVGVTSDNPTVLACCIVGWLILITTMPLWIVYPVRAAYFVAALFA